MRRFGWARQRRAAGWYGSCQIGRHGRSSQSPTIRCVATLGARSDRGAEVACAPGFSPGARPEGSTPQVGAQPVSQYCGGFRPLPPERLRSLRPYRARFTVRNGRAPRERGRRRHHYRLAGGNEHRICRAGNWCLHPSDLLLGIRRRPEPPAKTKDAEIAVTIRNRIGRGFVATEPGTLNPEPRTRNPEP